MIYAYIRVSTDKQTVENQRFEINRFAKQRDFQIDVWVEETVSGTRSAKDRKLGVLLKRIKKGDTLIVSEISRLGRRLMEVMSILNACMLKMSSCSRWKRNMSWEIIYNLKYWHSLFPFRTNRTRLDFPTYPWGTCTQNRLRTKVGTSHGRT